MSHSFTRVPRHLTALLAGAWVMALAGAAAAQPATYGYFGAPARLGCSPVGPPVEHTALGVPQLGTTFTVQLPASNGDCSYLCNLWFLATGLSDTSFLGAPLPYTPGPWTGLPACGALRVSLDLIEPIPFGSSGGATAQVALAIPNAPSLTGFEFFQQPFTMTFILGGLNTVALGRAGHGTVGN